MSERASTPIQHLYPSGGLKSLHFEVNGKKEGFWRIWSESGQLIFEAEYKNDLLHGLERSWSGSDLLICEAVRC